VASYDEADPGHPYSIAEAWADRLPQGRLVSEEQGQSPLAWQGGRLSRVIADFCEEPRSRRGWRRALEQVEVGHRTALRHFMAMDETDPVSVAPVRGELRYGLELARLLADGRFNRVTPAADPRPVLLIPGFLAGDVS